MFYWFMYLDTDVNYLGLYILWIYLSTSYIIEGRKYL